MAMILDAFAGKVVEKLAECVEEKVVTILGVKDELKRLQRRMERINRVLKLAERKRIQPEDVADWVRELKDVMYDADDIIDRCRFEGGKLLDDQASSSSSPPRSVRCNLLPSFSCFSSVRFRHEIGNDIKTLNERLDEIYKDMSGDSGLNSLKKELKKIPDVEVTRVNLRETTPLADPSDIVGGHIKDVITNMVDLIVKKDEQKCRVFAITGMGGGGKTTLAQNIFNHQKIESAYPEKVWVCISKNFSETDKLKEIIRGVGGNHGDQQSKAELDTCLKDVVSEKTLFLVLDDVWRADVWVDLLRVPLQSGAGSSCVLVTTRYETVATEIGVADEHIHHVEEWPEESGWELLRNNVFVSGEEEIIEKLKHVGIQIVQKCQGLPLAIKTIAGVLKKKGKSEKEWEEVLGRDAWEEVLRRDAWSMDNLTDDSTGVPDGGSIGALYLSYEDLPSHLKQCFLYFSIYPEDYAFSRRDVVRYWVVEEFVKTRRGSFLELAEEYFEELIGRNLIQKANIQYDNMFYKMHDLLRSLAQFLSKDENFCGQTQELTTISTTTKLRRLTITNEEDLSIIPDPLTKQTKLRSIRVLDCPRLSSDIFVRFPFLRSITLNDLEIENVPDALGSLIHLRLLDLDRTSISSLPESIRYLTNLQALNLSGCKSLHTLPKGITRLHNLMFINFEDTPLRFMPRVCCEKGMKTLEKVNLFRGFVVGDDNIRSDGQQEQGCSLEDLKSLSQLRELSVYKLERAVGAQTGQSLLKNKHHLKHLELKCTTSTDETSVEYTEVEIHKIEKVFTELAPPPCLETLKISGYFGRGLFCGEDKELTELPHLRELTIGWCSKLESLPRGMKESLELLKVNHCGSLERISNLSSLKHLYIHNCHALKCIEKLDVLERLTVQDCQSLERISNLSSLKHLYIYACHALKSIEKLDVLERLTVRNCRSLERISNISSLKHLEIHNRLRLKCIEKLDVLENVTLIDAFIRWFPGWLLMLLQQRQDDNFQLDLKCSMDLLNRCTEGCEYWPFIQNIPRLSIFSGKEKHMVYTKKPNFYKVTTDFREFMDLKRSLGFIF